MKVCAALLCCLALPVVLSMNLDLSLNSLYPVHYRLEGGHALNPQDKPGSLRHVDVDNVYNGNDIINDHGDNKHGSGYDNSYGHDNNKQGSGYDNSYGHDDNKHGSGYENSYGHADNKHGSGYDNSYGHADNKHGSGYDNSYGHDDNKHGSGYDNSFGHDNNKHGSGYDNSYGHVDNKHGSGYDNSFGRSSSNNNNYGNNDKHGSSYNNNNKHGSNFNDKHGTGYDNDNFGIEDRYNKALQHAGHNDLFSAGVHHLNDGFDFGLEKRYKTALTKAGNGHRRIPNFKGHKSTGYNSGPKYVPNHYRGTGSDKSSLFGSSKHGLGTTNSKDLTSYQIAPHVADIDLSGYHPHGSRYTPQLKNQNQPMYGQTNGHGSFGNSFQPNPTPHSRSYQPKSIPHGNYYQPTADPHSVPSLPRQNSYAPKHGSFPSR